jgi:hypothetical protein
MLNGRRRAFGGCCEVHPHRGAGGIGVTGDDGGRDVVVLVPDAVHVARVRQRVRVAEPGTRQHDHHRAQRVEQLDVEAVAGSRRDSPVKREVGLDLLLGSGLTERRERRTNQLQDGGVRTCGRECRRLTLDTEPEVEHVQHIVVGPDCR